ncbi:MAG: type VI secretion system baseplate subunit TssG [Flavihumibacter sp.]
MKTAKNIEALARELNRLSFPLKAETVLAHATHAGADRELFLVCCDRFFERPFLPDIVSVEEPAIPAEAGWLRAVLSRPGFFDLLPEGLFFQPGASQLNRSQPVAEMAAAYRNNKTKEKDIRLFFQPFEHGGFYQRLQLEEEEKQLMRGLSAGLLHAWLCEFWQLPDLLPAGAATIFLKMMPYASRITGNTQRMQELLNALLELPVSLEPGFTGVQVLGEADQPGLGEQVLGDELVCGRVFMEPSPLYRTRVEMADAAQMSECLPGGKLRCIIDTFARFFVPVEAVMEIEWLLPAKRPVMELTTGREAVLGFSACI